MGLNLEGPDCVRAGLGASEGFDVIACCGGTSSSASGNAALSTIGVEVLMSRRDTCALNEAWTIF